MIEEMVSSRIIALPNKFRDPYAFEEVISLKEKIINDADSLDMSRISFIEPYSMLSFLLLGKIFLKQRGIRLKLTNIPLPIHQYLARMDFFRSDIFDAGEPLGDKLLLKRSALSKSIIEIVEIPNKERESVKVITTVIELFRKRASYILKHWFTENLVDYFVTVISELCQNIFEHSLEPGYLSMQTYTLNNEKIFRLVISDSGIGIIKSFEFNNKEIQYESPAKLMEMALTMPISSKREFGYGLCQVNSIIERLNGMIYIRSENASLSALYNKARTGTYIFLKNNLPYFNGTQISISLTA